MGKYRDSTVREGWKKGNVLEYDTFLKCMFQKEKLYFLPKMLNKFLPMYYNCSKHS